MERHQKRQQFRSGITLLEFLILLIGLLASLLIVGYFDFFGLGWIGFVVGVPLAFFGSLLTLWGILAVYVLIEGLFTGLPSLPTCDRCGSKMAWLDFGDYEPKKADDDWGWTCRCGRIFLRESKGRVVEVKNDGTKVPFRVWKSLCGWRAENQ